MKRFKAKIIDSSERMLKGKEISCNIINTMKQPPEWFIEFEKRNNAHWEKQEKFNEIVITRLDGIDQRLDKLDCRIDNLVTKNNLAE